VRWHSEVADSIYKEFENVCGGIKTNITKINITVLNIKPV
jgi:hypothetical protein